MPERFQRLSVFIVIEFERHRTKPQTGLRRPVNFEKPADLRIHAKTFSETHRPLAGESVGDQIGPAVTQIAVLKGGNRKEKRAPPGQGASMLPGHHRIATLKGRSR